MINWGETRFSSVSLWFLNSFSSISHHVLPAHQFLAGFSAVFICSVSPVLTEKLVRNRFLTSFSLVSRQFLNNFSPADVGCGGWPHGTVHIRPPCWASGAGFRANFAMSTIRTNQDPVPNSAAQRPGNLGPSRCAVALPAYRSRALCSNFE